jgi:membrane protein YdbS with pleckstrin-like domain
MLNASRRSWIVLIGTVVVILMYYVVHRPPEPSIAFGLMNALASIVAIGSYHV